MALKLIDVRVDMDPETHHASKVLIAKRGIRMRGLVVDLIRREVAAEKEREAAARNARHATPHAAT